MGPEGSPHVRRRLLLLALTAVLVSALVPGTAGADAATRWMRVRIDDRIVQAHVDGLRQAGLLYLHYVPHRSFVGFGTPQAAAAAARVDGVAAVREVHDGEKVAGLTGASGVVPVAVVAVGSPTGALDRIGTVRGSFALHGSGALTVTDALIPASSVGVVAAMPRVLSAGRTGVRWATEDEGATQILAGSVEDGVPVPGYEPFLDGLGIDGEGVTLSVVDDGLDANHPELTGRVTKIAPNELTDAPAQGHGTHVAGIIGGIGATIGPLGRIEDSRGLLYGIGVAPGVTFIDQPAIQLQNTLGPPGDFPPAGGFQTYTVPSVQAGAIGWNASWTDGGGAGAGYNANAANLDALTRDADPGTEGNQPYTFVFSAGNSGSGNSPTATRITSPKEAKNIIAVASSVGHRAGNINQISSFSSRGPARDGRIVPTVAAPGEGIVSARATTGALCGESPAPDGFGLYSSCSGTSMASPQVAGSVALIHDWWRERNDGADPSPAMDKALLVNSATDMGPPNVPNRHEGWGRVNLRELFDPETSRVLLDQSVVLTDPGESRSFSVTPADPSKPLRVTLAWTDAAGVPGDPVEPALVNDLDLTVTAEDGTAFSGNAFEVGRSVAGGETDRLNNLENILLESPDGSYLIEVGAFALPGDGVPGAGDETDQDFALVISNAVLAA